MTTTPVPPIPMLTPPHPREPKTVYPDTLVTFDTIGIQVRAGRTPDADGGQLYVTVNTENVPAGDRYDEATGLNGGAQPFTAGDGPDGTAVVRGPGQDGPIVAQFFPTTLSYMTDADNHAASLNHTWAEDRCGMPIIMVDLNGSSLYDDEGRGDTVRAAGSEIYVVRPDDPSEDTAAFADEADAEAFAATFVNVGDVERVLICDGNLANKMIRERTESDD